MKPDDSILFSKRACWVNTILIAFTGILLSALLSMRSLALTLYSFLIGICYITGIVGWVFSWFANRVVITRLKVRYPENAQKIEDYRFGRGAGGVDVMISSIIQEKDMLPFVTDDPQREQMLAERGTLERFGLLWRWGWLAPMLLLLIVGAILR